MTAYAAMRDFPGYFISLEREFDEMPSQLNLAKIALGSVFDFSAEFCVPLTMELWTTYWMNDFDLAIEKPSRAPKYMMLRQHEIPTEVDFSPCWVDEQVTTTDEINEATSHQFTQGALQRQPNDRPELEIGWQEMRFRSTAVRLPDDPELTYKGSVGLRVGTDIAQQRIEQKENGFWISGPAGSAVIHPPIEIRIGRDSPETLTFEISIYWSTWAPNGAGYEKIVSRVDALLDKGWVKSP
ncbi:hypothetical protein AB0D04_21710 [Streptomyces sp. NPDC048483]|uniref:hypothetical protein n=1 Tax=Streptomyces sp. NPDC048483 TaxID=3154927 RepID=UPI0034238D4D